jgi:NitT/TauT family transport system substrate-binding protein
MSRRSFLQQTSALGMASLFGLSREASAGPMPETRRIRIASSASICVAPQVLAEEMLRAEGFSGVEYPVRPPGTTYPEMLASGDADLAMASVELVTALDTTQSILLLAGVHSGCWELFGNANVHAIRDLKGKAVAVSAMGAAEHVFLSSMAAYVGLDPKRDIRWLPAGTYAESLRAFVQGRADAFLGFPPQPQELRSQNVGHVIVNTSQDRPWSQYFCCMVAARREFVQNNPVATKMALRAILKAADICSQDSERAARFMVAKGYALRSEVVQEVLEGLRYDRWRDTDPEDTIRFHALRLREVGMIKSSPQKLIEQGTDWRFLNELKKELKA